MFNSVRQKSGLALMGAIFLLAGCTGATDTLSEAEDVVPVEETTEAEAVAGVSDNYVVLYSGRKESLVQPLIDIFHRADRYRCRCPLCRDPGARRTTSRRG